MKTINSSRGLSKMAAAAAHDSGGEETTLAGSPLKMKNKYHDHSNDYVDNNNQFKTKESQDSLKN